MDGREGLERPCQTSMMELFDRVLIIPLLSEYPQLPQLALSMLRGSFRFFHSCYFPCIYNRDTIYNSFLHLCVCDKSGTFEI